MKLIFMIIWGFLVSVITSMFDLGWCIINANKWAFNPVGAILNLILVIVGVLIIMDM